MTTRLAITFFATVAASAVTTFAFADAPILSLPIDCELGETCYIQNYVDRDPGPEATNFACGALTYNGHKGTDIGLPSMAAMRAGVDVLAAASGVVAGVRNGMPDILSTNENRAQIKGRECGNGLVIRHADGWETQYCHMKQDSVIVAKGMQVSRGDILGQVGLSGRTQFPHIHLSVRHNRVVIDPFDTGTAVTCGTLDNTLWQDTPPYIAGNLISIGFATKVPKYDTIKDGSAAISTLPTNDPALVLWGFAYGSKVGDQVRILITGPQGTIADSTTDLTREQAQYFRAAGKKRPRTGWPPGDYSGTVALIRDGRIFDEMHTKIRTEKPVE